MEVVDDDNGDGGDDKDKESQVSGLVGFSSLTRSKRGLGQSDTWVGKQGDVGDRIDFSKDFKEI